MIVYFYTDIDNLKRILALNAQGNPCIKLAAKHRSSLKDDPSNTFGRYLLPSCLGNIEAELEVAESSSLVPLLGFRPFMEAIISANKVFDDRNEGLKQFVLSFYEDMDKLDLWTRYGDSGRGVAIGFDTNLLQQPYGQVFNFSFEKCNYWSKEIEKAGYQLDKNSALYKEVKEMYKSMSNSKIAESFKIMYSQENPEAIVTQRIKETLLHNLITTFDLFHKCDDWQGEKEHRMTVSVVGPEIQYAKDTEGNYNPFFELVFPVESLKIIMIGPKTGRNAYGMIQSLLFERKIQRNVQVLNSNCPM